MGLGDCGSAREAAPDHQNDSRFDRVCGRNRMCSLNQIRARELPGRCVELPARSCSQVSSCPDAAFLALFDPQILVLRY